MINETSPTILWHRDGLVCQAVEHGRNALEIQKFSLTEYEQFTWQLTGDQALMIFTWLSQTAVVQESEALVNLLQRFQERRSSYVGD